MSKTKQDIGGNAIIYSYPNGDWDLICAAERTFLPAGWEEAFASDRGAAPRPSAREAGKKSEGDDRLRSMRRARAKLRRLALSNEFEWFVTLTLNKDRVDRYDPKAIMQKTNRCLDNLVRRYGLRYVLVPELHKDGAYHFHGFFAGDLRVIDSGVKHDGREVYNLPQWTLGFSTAMRLHGSYSAAVGYVCKYIGKQEGARPMGRWYYSGGALKEPPKEYATMDYRGVCEEFCGEAVEFEIPGSKIVVIHHREE